VGRRRVGHGRSPRRAGESLSLACCTHRGLATRPLALPFQARARNVSGRAGKAGAHPPVTHG
jgi:hypothetical protein